METIITPLQEEIIQAACSIAVKKNLITCCISAICLCPRNSLRLVLQRGRNWSKLFPARLQRLVIEAMGIPTISLPVFDLERPERFKIALVGGLAKGLFKQGQVVLGMLGRRPASLPRFYLW